MQTKPAQHTPTWRKVTANDYKSLAIEDSEHNIICEIDLEDEECFESDLNDKAKDNAHLIAAAPALLAACEAVSNLTFTYEPGSTGGNAIAQLRAAIALAKAQPADADKGEA